MAAAALSRAISQRAVSVPTRYVCKLKIPGRTPLPGSASAREGSKDKLLRATAGNSADLVDPGQRAS